MIINMKKAVLSEVCLLCCIPLSGINFEHGVLHKAPEEVAAPRAVATATTLLVSWDPPAKPNGNITGYFLYQDLVEVYAGGQQQFLVTQLRVSVGRAVGKCSQGSG